jgi:ABC-type branched-subunit amino acid transport system substrate-binding protein
VLEAMRSLGSFPGISGNYAFNPNGDPISVGYYVIQVDAQNWGANRVVQRLLSEPPE